jgi:hypothetical protein
MSNDEAEFDPTGAISDLELHAIARLGMMDVNAMLMIVINQWEGIKERAAGLLAKAIVIGRGETDAEEIKMLMVVALRATAFADIIDKMRQDPEMIAMIEPDPDAIETTYQELLAQHEVIKEEPIQQ